MISKKDKTGRIEKRQNGEYANAVL